MNKLIAITLYTMLFVVVSILGYQAYKTNQDQVALEQRVEQSNCYGDRKIYCKDMEGKWFTSLYIYNKLTLTESFEIEEGDVPVVYLISQSLTEKHIKHSIH